MDSCLLENKKAGGRQKKRCGGGQEILGTLRSNDATVKRTSLKK